MKYAICNETFQDWPFDKAFAFARACGYTGLEIAPFTIKKNVFEITPSERAAVRRQAESAGLEIIGLHWLLAFSEGNYLTSPDPETRRRTAAYFAELTRLCRDLGGHVMVLGSPKQRNLLPGVTHDQAMEYAADVIRGFRDELDRCHVKLALEPLGPEEGDFLRTADLAETLIDMVGSPHVGLHLDVKAMSSEGEAIDQIVRRHARRMLHFHANDANRRGPGMGAIDFVPILRALHDVGYDGWVSVEVFDYTPGIETLARDSLSYLQRCSHTLSEMKMPNQLAHMVYFKLKDASPAAVEQFLASCRHFLSGHDGTVYFSVSTLCRELKREVNDHDFDVALNVVFASKEAHDQYQAHPRHIEFINTNKPNWARVRVFDSYVK